MNIIARTLQITWAATVDQLRFVAATKKMSPAVVAPVEALRLSGQQPFHPNHEIWLWSFYHEMKMITQQTIGMDLPSGSTASLLKRSQKCLPIDVIAKDVLTPVTPANDMVTRSGIFDSKRPRHAAQIA